MIPSQQYRDIQTLHGWYRTAHWLVFKPGVRPVRTWFLKIDPVRVVCMRACVCVRAQG